MAEERAAYSARAWGAMKYHIVGREADGHAGSRCGLAPVLNMAPVSVLKPAEVDVSQRCRARGCAERWPAIEEG